MCKVQLTIKESRCRGGLHIAGQTFIVEDVCPPVCHELWQCIYPQVFALINDAQLDCGNQKCRRFTMRCPDEGRVLIEGKILGDLAD